MKIVQYLDAYAGMNPENAYIMQTPGKKYENIKRYKIVLEIPDWSYDEDEVVIAQAEDCDEN